MRLHRFYTNQKLSSDIVYTNQEHIHQWRNVFRYTKGDSLILFGDGFEHTYTIDSIDKKSSVLREVSQIKSRLQEKELTLALALIKKDNFELALEKCTEIGVTNFIPLITQRSLQNMYGASRLEKILIEATEQSGWGRVPSLQKPISFDTLLEQKNKDIFILNMSGQNISTIQTSDDLLLCVGPEGGWGEEELELIKKTDTTVVSLNTGILRAETAAILATGVVKNTH